MAGPPAGYEEVAAPSSRMGPPPGYEEVAPPQSLTSSPPTASKGLSLDRLANAPLPPPTSYLDAASRGLADVGQGVFQAANAIRHPIDTLNAMTQIGPKVMDFLSGSGEHTGQNPLQSAAEIAKNAAVNPAQAGQFISNQLGQIAATAGAGKALGAGLGAVNRIIPSTTRAGAGLNMLTDSPDAAFAQHPAETPNALATARKIESELAVTGEKPHPIIQHYMAGEELRNPPPEVIEQAKALDIDPTQPMNMYEARVMLKRVNDIIRNSKGFAADAATKTATTNLKRFAGALDEDISAAAEQGGFGKDYEAMKNEYKRGKQIVRAGEGVGEPLGALAGYELGHAAGEPLGATYLGAQIGKKAGKYTTGAAARALVERNAGPPRLQSLPASPEAYTRTILAAKEGDISPGEADRRIVKQGGRVKVRPIPQFQAEGE